MFESVVNSQRRNRNALTVCIVLGIAAILITGFLIHRSRTIEDHETQDLVQFGIAHTPPAPTKNVATSPIVRSKDERVEIRRPSGWANHLARGQSVIAIQSSEQAVVFVVSEPKADIAITTIDEYAARELEILKRNKSATNVVLSPLHKLTVGGRDALVRDYRVTVGGMNMRDVDTFIETETRWNCITEMTEDANFDRWTSDFKSIVDSFKEVVSR